MTLAQLTPETAEPTAADRRRAVCLAMGRAPSLIRFAARFSRSLPDGEDAYQRAMEIALQRAPICDEPRFSAWLRTVIRHEALAIAEGGRHESTGARADVAGSERLASPASRRPEVVAEWRDRHRAIRDALHDLSDAQRTCLMLVSAGFSYDHVTDVTGLTRRTVERAVLSGRAGLHRWEADVATGAACERLRPALERVGTGEAGAGEERRVTRHVQRCAACRSALRHRHESALHLASFVPAALSGAPLMTALPSADPSLVTAGWDRLVNGAVARMGQVTQVALDLSLAGLGRVGAKASMLAIAALVGLPLVADAVTPNGRPAPHPAAEVTLPSPIPPAVSGEPAAGGERRPGPDRATPPARSARPTARVRPAARPRALTPRRAARPAPERAAAVRPGAPPAPVPTASPRQSTHDPAPAPRPAPRAAALEFGP